MSRRRRKAYYAGRGAGRFAGSWVIDGNSTSEYCAAIVHGLDEGDPAILDLCPAPLSGEWTGESISELSERYGIDLSDDDNAYHFEDGFADGFWDTVVLRAAKNGVS